MYKPKSWPHGIIAAIVMAVFFFLVPELSKMTYAALMPVIYFYGREVRDAESSIGFTKWNYLTPLVPWFWKNEDNRMDFYYPIFAVGLLATAILLFEGLT